MLGGGGRLQKAPVSDIPRMLDTQDRNLAPAYPAHGAHLPGQCYIDSGSSCLLIAGTSRPPFHFIGNLRARSLFQGAHHLVELSHKKFDKRDLFKTGTKSNLANQLARMTWRTSVLRLSQRAPRAKAVAETMLVIEIVLLKLPLKAIGWTRALRLRRGTGTTGCAGNRVPKKLCCTELLS